MKKISSAKTHTEESMHNLSFDSNHHTNNKEGVVEENESSQHSFGSSAMMEMRRHVNEFFDRCNSEKEFTAKQLSDLDKESFTGDRQCRI